MEIIQEETQIVPVKETVFKKDVEPSNPTELFEELEKPSDFQKSIALTIDTFLKKKIQNELDEYGYLSEITRKWIQTYNIILDSIHKNVYGTKSTNVNIEVGHSVIAAKIRETLKK